MNNPLSKFNPENNKTDRLRVSKTMKPCELCKEPYSTELNERFCGKCQSIKNGVEVMGMVKEILNSLYGKNKDNVMHIQMDNHKYISEVDYLKVVEENEKTNKKYWDLRATTETMKKELEKKLNEKEKQIRETVKLNNWNTKYYDQQMKEKDEVIESLKDYQTYHMITKEKHNDLKTLGNICNEQRVEIQEKNNEIEMLKEIVVNGGVNYSNLSNLYNERQALKEEINLWKKRYDDLYNEKLFVEDETTWTLKYVFENSETKEIKEYEQNGMLKEDAEELIGMDSDNWNHWSLTKEEKPDKDKIIEGLVIRCESDEEVIKELQEEIEELNSELYKARIEAEL